MLLVLVLTLTPQQPGPEAAQAARGPWGERGLADAIANLLLFAPLGMLLSGVARRIAPVALAGLAISAAIELAQIAIPGRFPSPWDVCFNAAGAAAGFALARTLPALLHASPRWRALLAIGFVLLAAAITVGGVSLFAPARVLPPLVTAWNPRTTGGLVYPGPVTRATLGRESLTPGPFPFREAPARRILAGDTLRLRFRLARPGPAPLPLLRIAFGKDELAAALLVRDDDVVFTFRTRAGALHLDQPDLRLPGALAGITAGTLANVAVWATPSRPATLCIAARSRIACRAPAIGDTWALLLFPVPRRLAAILPPLWLALLLLPAGLLLRRRSAAALLAAATLTVFVALRAAGLAPGPPPHLAAVPLGILAGHALAGSGRRKGHV